MQLTELCESLSAYSLAPDFIENAQTIMVVTKLNVYTFRYTQNAMTCAMIFIFFMVLLALKPSNFIRNHR